MADFSKELLRVEIYKETRRRTPHDYAIMRLCERSIEVMELWVELTGDKLGTSHPGKKLRSFIAWFRSRISLTVYKLSVSSPHHKPGRTHRPNRAAFHCRVSPPSFPPPQMLPFKVVILIICIALVKQTPAA